MVNSKGSEILPLTTCHLPTYHLPIFMYLNCHSYYSLRYGTLPIATNVGGLADTVVNASEENIENGTANGFVLTDQTAASLLAAVQHALALYQAPQIWRQLQTNAMSADFSWVSSADHYINLYQQALDER